MLPIFLQEFCSQLISMLSMKHGFAVPPKHGNLRRLVGNPGTDVCRIPPGDTENFLTQSIGGDTAIAGSCNDNCDYVCPLVLDRPNVCNFHLDEACEETGCTFELCSFKSRTSPSCLVRVFPILSSLERKGELTSMNCPKSPTTKSSRKPIERNHTRCWYSLCI